GFGGGRGFRGAHRVGFRGVHRVGRRGGRCGGSWFVGGRLGGGRFRRGRGVAGFRLGTGPRGGGVAGGLLVALGRSVDDRPHPVRDVLFGPRVPLELIQVGGRRQRALPPRLGIEVDVDPVARRTFDHVQGTQPSAHVRPVHSFAETLENALQLVGRVPSPAGTVLRGDLTQQIAVLTGGAVLHRDLLPVLRGVL